MMNKLKSNEPHVLVAVAVSGGMALALALGLDFLGIIGRMDSWLLDFLKMTGLSEPQGILGDGLVWGMAVVLSFLVAVVMLHVDGMWRRVFVWVVSLMLTIFWAPVVYLAAHKPDVSVAVVVVFWSGFCAMVYATNHVLRRESSVKRKKKHS